MNAIAQNVKVDTTLTTNRALVAWVGEMARLAQPAGV